MATSAGQDWDPGAYGRFRGLRLRPALDLLAQVGALPDGCVVDLGCGSGAAGPVLRARFADRWIEGVDLSPAMRDEARGTGAYDRLTGADIAVWRPETPPALIFSNAALQWVEGHGTLLPCLAGMLAPGGTLAVQMPRQFGAPSHRFLRDIAAEMFPDRFDLTGWEPPVWSPVDYHRLLSPLGRVSVWETDYVQALPAEGAAHPVRRFTESTVMRPWVARMDGPETAAFVARYEAALAAAYPRGADGAVLFPFRRVFLTLTV
jgi:trans-aconitate 2-methyltransferase